MSDSAAPWERDKPIIYRAIGVVENDFDAPAKPEEIAARESRIVLDPALTAGLRGLESGQQIMVVFHFHLHSQRHSLHDASGYALCQHPRGDRSRPQRGVFALRSPHRPNPIGVTVADLLAIDCNVLRVRGLDAINGTPVLDLKAV